MPHSNTIAQYVGKESAIVYKSRHHFCTNIPGVRGQNRIARGKLNLIVGHPGRGKSQLSLFMAALVSTGGLWPDGTPCDRGSVVLITCEDDMADTVVPRLVALGADRSRCHSLDGRRDETGRSRPFSLKDSATVLVDLARDISDLALVIIDPVSAYLDRIDSHNAAEMRGGLLPLQEFAARSGAAVVLVSHFSKGTPDGTAMSRVAGSGALVAVCRSAWLVERCPEDAAGHTRVLAP
jgi:putative DNA primase/helicase